MRLSLMLLVTAVAALTWSCRGGGDDATLLSTVPADAAIVCRVDVPSALQTLGVDMPSDAAKPWKAPVWLAAELDDARLGQVRKFTEAVADGRIICAQLTAKSPMLAIFEVADEKSLLKVLGDAGAKQMQVGALHTWSNGDWSVAVEGSLGWGCDGAPSQLSEAVEAMKKAVAADGALTMADDQGFARACDNGDYPVALSLFTGMEAAKDHNGAPRLSGGVTLQADTRLQLRLDMLYPDGQAAPIPGFAPIAPTALQYVPANSFFTLALALDDGFPWESFASTWLRELPLSAQAQASLLLEYLKGVDGTAVVAVAPKPGLSFTQAVQAGLEGMDFLVMAHMDQAAADRALNAIGQMASQYGATVTDAGGGLRRLSLMGTDWYAGVLEGGLTVATCPPSPNGSNALTAAFDGKSLGLRVSLPTLSPVYPCVETGLEFTATATTQRLDVELTTLPVAPLLPALWRADQQRRDCDDLFRPADISF